jgi:uncharacterized GH25 family protein
MQRLFLSMLLLAAAALPARAHFIWVLPPDGNDTKSTHVVFSDSPKPDDAELLKKIGKADVFARNADGKTVPLKLADGKQAFNVTAPDAEPHVIGVVLQYGVTQRDDDPAFLLHYYAKGFSGISAKTPPSEKFVKNALVKPWDKLPLEILPVLDGPKKQNCMVVWQGKPLADAEVTLYVPGKDKPVVTKTDEKGLVALELPEKSGVYGIRARHVEKKEGELDGKKYKEIRHYATMVFPVVKNGPLERLGAALVAAEPKRAADPAATKLLADARAARDTWHHFPGFTADIVVNLEGKTTKGTVKVNAEGEVDLSMLEGEAAKWAKGQLSSIVGHRLGGAELDTPCAFADDVTDHPLGRAIVVLNDEFHSSYRIKDRQILVVNRNMKDSHFTITVMENRVTDDKRFVPVTFVVNTWDTATGALQTSATHHQEWKHVGKFDLPAGLTVVTASKGKLEARSLTLTNQKLQ